MYNGQRRRKQYMYIDSPLISGFTQMYGSCMVSSRHAACALQPAAPAKINMINNVINGFYQVTSCEGVGMNRR